MTTTKLKRKTYYETIGRKEEFWREIKNKEHKTNQDELERASIAAMAEKYGIDAIQRKAEQMYIENLSLQNELYGHDLTQTTKVKEDILNNKNKLKQIFEMIPARLRKTLFNDNVGEFVSSYVTGDETKLKELNKYGLVSEKQLNKVKEARIAREKIEAENKLKIDFANALKKQEGELYETFKKTGNLIISSENNISANNSDV